MKTTIAIEDIEQMRQQQGIDDVALRVDIRILQVGDRVKLTFRKNERASQTVPVEITQIRPGAFRGKLMRRALTLPRGRMVTFTGAHIHSIVNGPMVNARNDS